MSQLPRHRTELKSLIRVRTQFAHDGSFLVIVDSWCRRKSPKDGPRWLIPLGAYNCPSRAHVRDLGQRGALWVVSIASSEVYGDLLRTDVSVGSLTNFWPFSGKNATSLWRVGGYGRLCENVALSANTYVDLDRREVELRLATIAAG